MFIWRCCIITIGTATLRAKGSKSCYSFPERMNRIEQVTLWTQYLGGSRFESRPEEGVRVSWSPSWVLLVPFQDSVSISLWPLFNSSMILSFGIYFHAGFLLSEFFGHEDGRDVFLRNVGWFSTDYTAFYLPTALTRVSCSAYFSVLKMETICSSETSLDTQRTTRHSACHLLSLWFRAQIIFRPWRWRRYVPPKRRLTLNELHGILLATCFHAGFLLR
jgi:hypothetical protein